MLKRRLNPFLLASTVLILSLLAGLSVLYQGQLDNVVSDRQDLEEELEQKNQRVSELQAENSNLSSQLTDTQNDLDRYIRLYNSTQEQAESLNQEVSGLEDSVANLQSQIETLTDNVDDLNQSLGDICGLEYGNMTDTGQNQCEEHGHEG